MGCGCAKATNTTNQRINADQLHPISPALLRLATEEHRTDSSLFRAEYVVRFTRESELMDFYERTDQRLQRNREMLDTYAHSDMNSLEDQGKPRTVLQLDYVYGYRCFLSRQNVYYTSLRDTIVYPAAALGVLLNTSSNTQTFLGGGDLISAQGHSDEVVAMTVNQTRELVATGEVGRNPLICIWKLEQEGGVEIRRIEQGIDTRAVAFLCFSEDSKQLIAVDQAKKQSIRIYEWKESTVPTHVLDVGKGRVWSVRWSPKGNMFCGVGREYFMFWTVKGHEYIKHKPGSFDSSANMNVVQWLSTGSCVTGGSDGQLYLWIDRNLKNKYMVLDGCEILALAIVNNVIVLGGASFTVRVLNATFKEIARYQVPDWVMSVDKFGDNVLCSTRNGIIQELSGNSRSVLMESHCEREVWGIAPSPTDWHIIVSVGDDNKLKSWDLIQRRCVSTCILESNEIDRTHRVSFLPKSQQSRALAISPKGHVAVAHNDGRISIRNNIHQLNLILHMLTEPRDWIQALQYSPKGSALAAGSVDSWIYVYNVSARYTLFHRLSTAGRVAALDWCVDDIRLRGTNMEGEVGVWDVQSGLKIDETGDEQWSTWTSASGSPVSGINQLSPTPSFITCVRRSQDAKHFAVGNSWGLLEIYDNPNSPGSKSNIYRGHSLEIVNAVWTRQDRVLLTVGGSDLAVIQWKVTDR